MWTIKKGQRERLINSITLPSPLRSSAGSRRACRKQEEKENGEGERERESSQAETEGREREEREGEKERERERERQWLEHEKPGNNMRDVAGSAKPKKHSAGS